MFRMSPTFSGCSQHVQDVAKTSGFPQHFQDVPNIVRMSPTISGCSQQIQDAPNIFRMSPTFSLSLYIYICIYTLQMGQWLIQIALLPHPVNKINQQKTDVYMYIHRCMLQIKFTFATPHPNKLSVSLLLLTWSYMLGPSATFRALTTFDSVHLKQKTEIYVLVVLI